MKKEVQRVGPDDYRILLGEMVDWSVEHCDRTVLMFTIISIIQSLETERYREVMKGIVEAVCASDNAIAIRCMTSRIARTMDYTLDQERPRVAVSTVLVG